MPDWTEANQTYLSAALAVVRARLELHAARVQNNGIEQERLDGAIASLEQAAQAMPAPATVDVLCNLFGLSPFERELLLLCAGMELDADFPALCAAAQNDPQQAHPTFGLALAALPAAHWSGLSPDAPLRYWRLLEVGSGSSLISSPLCIDERTLHFLAGVNHLDEHLMGFVQALLPANETLLAPSHRQLVNNVAGIWDQAPPGPPPAVQLCGPDGVGKRAIAAAAVTRLGLNLYLMPAHVFPTAPHDLDVLIRLWEREAALGNSALLLDCSGIDATDAARAHLIDRFIEAVNGVLLVSGPERRRARHRPLITFDVAKPIRQEQRSLWDQALGPAPPQLNGQLQRLVSQFDLSPASIRSAYSRVAGQLSSRQPASTPPPDLGNLLWDACRLQARPRLDDLAQRIEPVATWHDLVLPEAQLRTLRDIAIHVRRRARVYEDWGFAAKSARGLGISALFAGASGTGKTMAAEVLANELQLDLYLIDLSGVVSKYIGETEKNLSRVFDAAEEGGAILLFDEADALFGKRSEVKDSHDRYANIEISYLLQRMEAYRGLAILTSNMKQALDDAFLRRIRFVVQFPFPDAKQRAEIWRRMFPEQTPLAGLDPVKLARLNVTGGNIRNIALHAAFLAADADEPVRMAHLFQAARVEYAKLEKPLTAADTRGWV